MSDKYENKEKPSRCPGLHMGVDHKVEWGPLKASQRETEAGS